MTPTLSLPEIESAANVLRGRIVDTPTLELNSHRIKPFLPTGSTVHMKMELFQQAGSFKARGVLLAIDALNDTQRKAGVTAVSAGNHALAVSWGAKNAGLSAKVVMPKSADKIRVDGCKALGADVVLMDDVAAAFDEVNRLVEQEGRTMLHPFESPYMRLGAATCARELMKAAPDLDVVVIPIGGGGLVSGMSAAIKLLNSNCEVIGIEPFGADSMWRSFKADEAVSLEKVDTVADSLGAPMTLPDSFNITKANVSKIARLSDDEMCNSMKRLYEGLKIVAEPACASTTAAIMGPLKEQLEGKSVGIIACGSNISLEKFMRLTS